MGFYRETNLRNSLLIWFLIMVVCPLLLSTFIYSSYVNDLLKREAYHYLSEVSDKQAKFIDFWLQERMATIRLLSSSSQVQSLDKEKIEQLFKLVVENKKDYDNIVLVDNQGKVVVDPLGRIGVDLTDREYFQAAMQGKEYITEILAPRNVREKTPVIVFSCPVIIDNKIQGLIVGAVTLKEVNEVIYDLDRKTNNNTEWFGSRRTESYLINKDKLIITQLREDTSPTKLDNPAIQSVLQGKSGVEEYINYQGTPVLGAYHWIPGAKLALIAEQPKTIAFLDSAKHNQFILMQIIFLLVILFTAFNLFITKRIIQPLDELVKVTGEIAAGNLEKRVEEPNIGNEVGLLARTFNQMATTLQYSYQRLEEKNKILETMAVTDPLTGLYNRGYLLERIRSEVRRARQKRDYLTVMMIDIDHFKLVNDTYGHQAGDEVLQELSRILQSNVRKEDLVARYGGEEFTVVYPSTSLEEAQVLAERVRKKVAEHQFNVNQEKLKITISLGIAYLNNGGNLNLDEVVQGLLQQADSALYKAKANGRNRIELFTKN